MKLKQTGIHKLSLEMNTMDKLLTIQKELPKIGKDANNPYFNSSYLTLEKLLETVLPLLNKQGLLLVQYPGIVGEVGVLVTEIWDKDQTDKPIHQSTMGLSSKAQDPQAQGSAITYARRYALMSILGIVPGETDDDANAASPAPIEKAMSKAQWATLGVFLEEKGIKTKEEKIAVIRAIAGDKPLNSSAFARLEKDIKQSTSDALRILAMENL